jgi:hypothetical protein
MEPWGDTDRRRNLICRVSDVKFYERGPDHKRKDLQWALADTDRIRLEHTARRKTLRRHEIYELSDFIAKPQFHEINKNLYAFKYFDGSRKLTRFWNPYRTTDAKGNSGCFQLELHRHRHTVRNIHQYMRDLYLLDELKSDLRRAMIAFDAQWGRLL